jgi:NAD(P)H-flavin reductase
MYQVLTHALSDKANKTKFKLLFANVGEEDILLREEFDALKKKHPNTFDVVYILDHPPEKWTGSALMWNESDPDHDWLFDRAKGLYHSRSNQAAHCASFPEGQGQSIRLWYV